MLLSGRIGHSVIAPAVSMSLLLAFDHRDPVLELVCVPHSSSTVLPLIHLLTHDPFSQVRSPTWTLIFPFIAGGASCHSAIAGKKVSILDPLAPANHLHIRIRSDSYSSFNRVY